ncbi:MAG: hypothetical protein NTW35_03815 [Candidatus Nomurabacteria bacterium]|nr:hypothetical protein [Candidatus Nomurabacteria bacterium]
MVTPYPLNTILIVGLVVVFFFLLFPFIFNKRKNRSGIDKFEELHKKIREDIKFAISPKFIELSMGVNELVDLAVEIWRIEQRIIKVTDILPENQKKGLENSISKLKRYISNYDIEVIEYTNQKFNDGLNLDILSVEKDPNIEISIVKETVEPTVLVKGQVVKKAKVILLSKQD